MKTEQEIMNTIRALAHSQGSYSRLYIELQENDEYRKGFIDSIVNDDEITDAVSLIMRLEA